MSHEGLTAVSKNLILYKKSNPHSRICSSASALLRYGFLKLEIIEATDKWPDL